jgi:MerR family transcriptional regulator, light-induced transcriptional regulator
MANEILFPVKAVIMRTGLSAHVLRIWERRYGVVAPRRSGSNRRLYSEADIARLILLKSAVDAGHAIGSIAGFGDEVLARLSRRPESKAAGAGLFASLSEGGSARDWLDQAHAAVRAMDAKRLGNLLQRAAVMLSRPVLIGEVVAPLVSGIGDAWQSGNLRIAHEHVATGVIRFFLSDLLQREKIPEGAPHLVAAAVSGQVHDLGVLLAAVVAASVGWKVTYLGSDLPAEEIAAVVSSHPARAVALSLVYPDGDPATAGEIRRLRQLLPDSVAILVGGRAAASYRALVDPDGFSWCGSITALPELLADLQ